MKVRLIGPRSEHLAEALRANGDTIEEADQPSDDVDVNHWLSVDLAWQWRDTLSRGPAKHTLAITRPKDPDSALQIAGCRFLDAAVCSSQAARDELHKRGVARTRLHVIEPAHDGRMRPRRLVIGITSKMYPDLRKREDLLLQLSLEMSLAAFEFRIFGDGWETVIAALEDAGATVVCDPGSPDRDADYARIVAAVPQFDYYLYTGLDEGSMGYLDAVTAGVQTIVTTQGFHLDVPGGITHPFVHLDELRAIFERIGSARAERAALVENLTWKAHASKHRRLWLDLLTGRETPVAATFQPAPAPTHRATRARYSEMDFFLKVFLRDLLVVYPGRFVTRIAGRLWAKLRRARGH